MNFVLRKLYEDGKRRDRNPGPGDLRAYNARHAAVPLPQGLREELDVSFETDGAHSLMTDIIIPEYAGDEKRPVLVTVHGGALLFGDRKLNRLFRIEMAGMGCLVYSLDYRLLNETDFFGAVSDVCFGLEFVQETLHKYNGDPDRIHIVGESAGGLLALYCASMTGSETVRKQIGTYCPEVNVKSLILSSAMLYTTRLDYIAAVYKKDLYGARCRDKEFMKYMNPEYPEVMKSLPPVCLTTGYGDFLRKVSLRYAQALEKAGHPYCLLDYDDGEKLPHAFATLFPSFPESVDAMKKMMSMINSDDEIPACRRSVFLNNEQKP